MRGGRHDGWGGVSLQGPETAAANVGSIVTVRAGLERFSGDLDALGEQAIVVGAFVARRGGDRADGCDEQGLDVVLVRTRRSRSASGLALGWLG